ncbi:sensor histidine kinase [Methanobacterium oryzae]|uniref:sensor histidine kinase n=1 Tax=Methanobacterium oryzae TaxID=69540 RepID=UPI003D1CCD00
MFFSSHKRNIKMLQNILIILTAILAILSILNNYLPISDFGSLPFLITNLLVVIILFLVAKESLKFGKKAFRGWILIALSILVTLLGNIMWIVLLKFFNQPSSPSIADIFYLAYYPLIIVGILHLPVNQTHEIKKYQILLDTGILIVLIALILWISLINPILNSENSVSMIISLSYLLLDIFLLFTLVYLLFNWFGQVKKIPLSLLTISAAVLVITNIIFVYQFLYGEYNSSGLLDAGWLISYILTAFAGIFYINDEKIKFLPSLSYKFPIKTNLSFYLPFIWLFFIYLLLFWIYTHPQNSNLNLLICGAGIITMMFIRQILALEDSNRTRRLLQDNQEILEKREKHLSLITDNMMDLITRNDVKGIYQYVSPSAVKVLSNDPQNMLGKNVLDFVHPEDIEKLKVSFQKSICKNSPNEVEYRYKKANGKYIWLETVGTPIFDNDKNHNGFVCSSRNIDDRKQAEERIKLSLEEKEVLLKEIHHRVKNNMQIISSLLNLQSNYVKNGNEIEIFKESQDRVRSMAMIHENLYKSENIARINFGEYIQKLVSGLFSSYGIKSNMIQMKMNLDDVLMDIDQAIPCGLILNELITNSIKHAFLTSEGLKERYKMNIILSKHDNMLKIVVSDNGVGFPENIDFQNTESLGLQLVKALVNQLNGKIELERNNGTKFTLKFKKNN